MSRAAQRRWDQMSPRERCFALFKRIDLNTRALAKVASAIDYLGGTEFRGPGLETTSEAPDLYVALRTILRERRVLREAQELELLAARRAEAAKATAAAVRGARETPPVESYGQ
jgi:hypothetical protein